MITSNSWWRYHVLTTGMHSQHGKIVLNLLYTEFTSTIGVTFDIHLFVLSFWDHLPWLLVSSTKPFTLTTSIIFIFKEKVKTQFQKHTLNVSVAPGRNSKSCLSPITKSWQLPSDWYSTMATGWLVPAPGSSPVTVSTFHGKPGKN